MGQSQTHMTLPDDIEIMIQDACAIIKEDTAERYIKAVCATVATPACHENCCVSGKNKSKVVVENTYLYKALGHQIVKKFNNMNKTTMHQALSCVFKNAPYKFGSSKYCPKKRKLREDSNDKEGQTSQDNH